MSSLVLIWKDNSTQCLRTYRAAFPADVGIDLHVMDYYFFHGHFDETLACIDRLDRVVGGDPLWMRIVRMPISARVIWPPPRSASRTLPPQNPSYRHGEIYYEELVLEAEKKLLAAPPAGGPTLVKTSPGESAGEAEARAFAESFAKTVMSSDTAAVRAAFDNAALSRRCLAKLDVPQGTQVSD